MSAEPANGDDHENDHEGQTEEKEVVKELEEKLWNAFNTFDKEGSGHIKSSEVKPVLELINIQFSQSEMFKMISEIDPHNTGEIPFSTLKPIILEREVQKLKSSDDRELLDAFVAMGGDSDMGGCVDAKKLIDTIKNEF